MVEKDTSVDIGLRLNISPKVLAFLWFRKERGLTIRGKACEMSNWEVSQYGINCQGFQVLPGGLFETESSALTWA